MGVFGLAARMAVPATSSSVQIVHNFGRRYRCYRRRERRRASSRGVMLWFSIRANRFSFRDRPVVMKKFRLRLQGVVLGLQFANLGLRVRYRFPPELADAALKEVTQRGAVPTLPLGRGHRSVSD
jgi:hypothetical protein